MKVNFFVDEHVLIWNLLFQSSISEQIYILKKKLWENYRNEYNSTYRDKSTILKDFKNFIPNDDIIYNIVKETKEYEKLKRSADKYRNELMKLWDSNKKIVNILLKNILKKEIKPYNILVVNEELNVVETNSLNQEEPTLIIGKNIDKKNPMRIIIEIVMAIVKQETKLTTDKEEIGTAIVELAILNEFATLLEKKSCYLTGTPALADLKIQLYPFWLMYLSVTKDKFRTYIERDKIDFDIDSITYVREINKMNLDEFITYCFKQRKEPTIIGNIEM